MSNLWPVRPIQKSGQFWQILGQLKAGRRMQPLAPNQPPSRHEIDAGGRLDDCWSTWTISSRRQKMMRLQRLVRQQIDIVHGVRSLADRVRLVSPVLDAQQSQTASYRGAEGPPVRSTKDSHLYEERSLMGFSWLSCQKEGISSSTGPNAALCSHRVLMRRILTSAVVQTTGRAGSLSERESPLSYR